MNPERVFEVIQGAHMTEKSVMAQELGNAHIFKVSVDSTKREIKQAIEALFEVEVVDVRTINQNGKRKNFGRRQGKRNDWKKAYVKLAEGQSLDAEAGA